MKQRNENSGLIDLDALMREAESAPTLPASSRADDSLEAVTADVTSTREIPAIAAEPKPARAPDPVPAAAPASAPARVPAPAPERAPAPAPVAASRPSRGRGRLLLGLVAVAAAMTVTITLARAPRPEAPPAVAVTTPTSTPAAPPPPVETTPAPAPVDPNALPAVATAEAPAPQAAAAAALAPRPKATAAAAPDPAATAKLDELASAPADAKGDLGGAMRSAVGDRGNDGAAKTDEASGPSAGQVRPSQGAVVGAINSVLPAARACLGPDDAIRTGLVVFKSDGSVARIDMRGSKPEDACVKDALSKARVAPFADDTFATRVTVRP